MKPFRLFILALASLVLAGCNSGTGDRFQTTFYNIPGSVITKTDGIYFMSDDEMLFKPKTASELPGTYPRILANFYYDSADQINGADYVLVEFRNVTELKRGVLDSPSADLWEDEEYMDSQYGSAPFIIFNTDYIMNFGTQYLTVAPTIKVTSAETADLHQLYLLFDEPATAEAKDNTFVFELRHHRGTDDAATSTTNYQIIRDFDLKNADIPEFDLSTKMTFQIRVKLSNDGSDEKAYEQTYEIVYQPLSY